MVSFLSWGNKKMAYYSVILTSSVILSLPAAFVAYGVLLHRSKALAVLGFCSMVAGFLSMGIFSPDQARSIFATSYLLIGAVLIFPMTQHVILSIMGRSR